MESREFALGGKPLVFCMFPAGTKLVPNATLRGMECQRTPGAKRRCGPATNSDGGASLHSRHDCRGLGRRLHPTCGLLRRRLRWIIGRGSSDAQGGRDALRSWLLQKLLKVRIFGED